VYYEYTKDYILAKDILIFTIQINIMRILISVLFLILCSPIVSQGIIDKMADLTCQCMEDKGIEGKTSEEVTDIMTNCLTQNLIENISQFQEELDVDFTDQEAMRDVGEKIGAKMAFVCPETIMALAGITEDLNEEDIAEENTFTGTIDIVKADDGLTVLFLTTSGGMTEPFVWLASFEGDEALIDLKENLKGTSLTVKYEELDIFNGKRGEYVTRKIITEASINN
jgi:hypothetical protein